MKISISNIAWDKKSDEEVYEILEKEGVYGLDIAPGRIFDNPEKITQEQGKEFIHRLKRNNLIPVGMQSLLFGTNGLNLFEECSGEQTVVHLKKMMDYASKIGITRLVFGSPKNRLVKDKSKEVIEQLCSEVFNELGDYAIERNMYFCIEPNPVVYGADFVTNTIQGIELVKKINNPGFRLHMDLGTMIMNAEEIERIVELGLEVTEHIHLSHPNLEQVIGCEEIHKRFARALTQNRYKGVVAIEMKNSMQENNIKKIRETIKFIISMYG